jgi:hypothetical protein
MSAAVMQQLRQHAAATPQGRSHKGTGMVNPLGSTHDHGCNKGYASEQESTHYVYVQAA